jgi:hypothetical protein
VYTVLSPYSPSYTPFSHSPHSHWHQPIPTGPVLPPILQFKKKKTFLFVPNSYTGSFLVTLP